MHIDGKAIAAELKAELTERIAKVKAAGVTPTLAIVVATDDEGTAWYVRSIVRSAAAVGIEARVVELARDATRDEIRSALRAAADDPDVHGVICQTPLPHGLKLDDVADAIPPAVDIDGGSPVSIGMLATGHAEAFAPATAAAVLLILDHFGATLSGRRVVVVGRSTVVGKPAALLLLDRHATVTICHSRTVDLKAITREAEILVAAVGRPKMINKEYVRQGAIVIDVGTNPTPEGGLVGDVDTADVEGVVGAITPVPGGVGPVTTMLLLGQLVTATERAL